MKVNESNEKIRNIFNELKNAIPTLSSFPKLKFKIPAISFKLYKHHINTFLSVCDKNILYKMSWLVFQSLFEGKEEFLSYTEEKEADMKLVIDIIKEKGNKDASPQNLLVSRGKSIKDKKNMSFYLTDIVYMLKQTLKIDEKIISVLLIYILNNDLTLPLFIDTMTSILKDKFPFSEINIKSAINSGISLKAFINNFDYMMYSFDNYKNLEWDEKEKKLKIISISINEIINTWENKDKETSKSKKGDKKKDKEDKTETINSTVDSITDKLEEIKISDKLKQEKRNNFEDKLKEEYEEKLNILKKNQENIILQLKKENEELKKTLLEKNSIIEENSYYLKMIGMRVVYKSLIDTLIYIFDLDEFGKLDEKVDSIQNYLSKNCNNKRSAIINTLSNIFQILNEANGKAHFINLDENILDQLLNIIQIFTRDDESNTLKDLFDSFRINQKFGELVRIRSQKFSLDFKVYKIQENKITKEIKNNQNNTDGIRFLNS